MFGVTTDFLYWFHWDWNHRNELELIIDDFVLVFIDLDGY